MFKTWCIIFISIILSACNTTDGLVITNTQKKTTIATFGNTKNDVFNSVKTTLDGGYVVAGYTQNTSSFNVWVAKFTSSHILEWQNAFGGNKDDKALDVIQTQDGNFAVLGVTQSTNLGANKSDDSQDVYLLKISKNGNLLWQNTYGFSGADYGTSLIETKNGNLVVTGVLDVTASQGQGNSKNAQQRHAGGDYWVLKLNASGVLIWRKYFGGTNTDTPLGVAEAEDRSLVIVGASDSTNFTIKNNIGTYDFWVIKLDVNGNLLWENAYGGIEIDEARAITPTSDGHFLIVGDTRSSTTDISFNNGGADVWALKIDTNGNKIWQQTYGGSSFDVARAVKPTPDTGFLIAGSSRSLDNGFVNNGQNDALVLKISTSGNLEWQTTIGGNAIDFLYGITYNNNTIIAVGETNSTDLENLPNKGFKDALLVKIDSNEN